MYNVFYNILQPSLRDLQLRYMDADSFVLSYTEGEVSDEHMDLSNLELTIKTNIKILGKFKREMGRNVIEDVLALTPKTYSFKDYTNKTKEKGIKNCNNAKHEEYYIALMYNTQRTVDEYRIQKSGDNMITTKTSKMSLNTFDEKRFYVKNFKCYPHDENLYLFKRDLVTKINNITLELLIKLGLDVSKESLESLKNNILELNIYDDRRLIEAAIKLYNDL